MSRHKLEFASVIWKVGKSTSHVDRNDGQYHIFNNKKFHKISG